MFVTTLRFTEKLEDRAALTPAHNEWIARGFRDGVFLCIGSLEGGAGGAIIARGESQAEHQKRIAADPFVEAAIVTAETFQFDVRRTVPTLMDLFSAS